MKIGFSYDVAGAFLGGAMALGVFVAVCGVLYTSFRANPFVGGLFCLLIVGPVVAGLIGGTFKRSRE